MVIYLPDEFFDAVGKSFDVGVAWLRNGLFVLGEVPGPLDWPQIVRAVELSAELVWLTEAFVAAVVQRVDAQAATDCQGESLSAVGRSLRSSWDGLAGASREMRLAVGVAGRLRE
jgi:hypothetical protein